MMLQYIISTITSAILILIFQNYFFLSSKDRKILKLIKKLEFSSYKRTKSDIISESLKLYFYVISNAEKCIVPDLTYNEEKNHVPDIKKLKESNIIHSFFGNSRLENFVSDRKSLYLKEKEKIDRKISEINSKYNFSIDDK